MLNRTLVSLLPLVPRPLVWRFSRRYIAGKSLDAALECVQDLNQNGMSATLDVLGEDTTSTDDCLEGRDLYLRALEKIEKQELDCNISVKLSQMGLRFDPELCRSVMRDLVSAAEERRNFVRIDMEDASVTQITLDIYRELRRQYRCVGTVIQAYLFRTPKDVAQLLEEKIGHLRLCKGIYVESPEIAITDREGIRDAYNEILDQLIEGDAEKIAIATHDRPLVDAALERIEKHQLPKERYEFQMLLGVTEGIRKELVDGGHPLRVYVPFGEQWYAYSSRRLRENPQIAGHVIKNLFRRQ